MSTLSSESTGSNIRLDNLGDFSGDVYATNIVGSASVSSPYISGTSIVSNGINVTGNITASGRLKGLAACIQRSATATQSCNDSGTTDLLFGTVNLDQGTHNITYASGTGIFTSTIAQQLLVTYTVPWPSYATEGNRLAWIQKNALTEKFGCHRMVSNAGGGVSVCGSMIVTFAANDTFSIRSQQNSIGGSLPTQFSSGYIAEIGIYALN